MQTLPGGTALDDRDAEPFERIVLDEREPELDGDGASPPGATLWDDETKGWVERGVDAIVVVGAVLFVLAQLGPRNILANTTPAGGDMGAHVWGPIYLRDHLLPSLRLSGWTPDWYDGFPAFRFYMVVPALAIVLLNAGLHGWVALLPACVGVGLLAFGWRAPHHSRRRRALVTAGLIVSVLGIGLPYGAAFKVVAVSGVVLMPLAAYVFGRLSGLPFPTPALLSAGTLIFLFNREPTSNGTGNIIGGNVTSTLAGEYSFSIALTLAIVFLGLVVHGMRTGRRRPLAALVLALTLTCHLIVGIFAVVVAVLALVVWPGLSRFRWLLPTGLVGFLLGAFWVVPFLLGHAYVNDMGWEKSPAGVAGLGWTHMLTDTKLRESVINDYLFPSGLYPVIALAFVGLAVSILLHIRAGWWLGLSSAVLAFGFIACPEDRLWNARILPFYYLTLCFLAAIGVAEVARAIALLAARIPERPVFAVTAGAPLLGVLAVLVLVGLPLQSLPKESSQVGTNGKSDYSWGPIHVSLDANPAKSWAQWNFSGYERKADYPEYYGLMNTMAGVGASNGCGRAMWEYEGTRLDRYGTPMAPMLLPLWTDGCIGSMEGLYFESSMTTPFHFLNQSELSTACSCAQRNLPYGGFNIDLGVKHMQLLGVRYYVASTPGAIQAAQHHPELTEIAASGPWHIFQIAGTDLVSPLRNEPAVVADHAQGLGWVYGDSSPHTSTVKANGPAVTWYLDPSKWDVYLATSGPSSWQRVASSATPERNAEPAVTVTGTRAGDDTIQFDVDRTGVPMLVKASYYPDWKVDGAEGPYRVAPNLMVVIPTASHVRLHFGRSSVELGSYLMTAIGLGCLALLARTRDVVVPALDPNSDQILNGYLDARPQPGFDDDAALAEPQRHEHEGGEPPGWPPPPPTSTTTS
ncbi:MAG: hypothetical protein ACR2LQ_06905 [Acidimicrobiales bacterium]